MYHVEVASFFLVAACVMVVLIWLPPYVASRRLIHPLHYRFVRVLTVVGMVLPPIWLLALVLACYYPRWIDAAPDPLPRGFPVVLQRSAPPPSERKPQQ